MLQIHPVFDAEGSIQRGGVSAAYKSGGFFTKSEGYQMEVEVEVEVVNGECKEVFVDPKSRRVVA